MVNIRRKVQKMLTDLINNGTKESDGVDLKLRIDEIYERLVADIQIPDKLYRYCEKPEYITGEIKNRRIYLSHVEDFNDFFDSNPALVENQTLNSKAGMGEYLHFLAGQGKDLGYWSAEGQTRARRSETYRQKLRIACFCDDGKTIPMWYFYANKYKGVCIEYDMRGYKEKLASEWDLQLLPVIYTNKAGKCMADRYDGTKESVYINSMIKSDDWKFEKEWRLIICDENIPEGDLFIPAPEITKIFYIEGKVDENLLRELEKTDQADKLQALKVLTLGGLC